MQKPQNRTFILILRLAYFSLMMKITIVNDLQKYVDSWENCQRVQTRNDHQKISNNNGVEFASNFRQNKCALVPILIWYFLRKKVAKKIHEKKRVFKAIPIYLHILLKCTLDLPEWAEDTVCRIHLCHECQKNCRSLKQIKEN